MTIPYTLLASESARARAYVQALCGAGLLPAETIAMKGDWTPPPGVAAVGGIAFDPAVPVHATLRDYGLTASVCDAADVNAPATIAALRSTGPDIVVYAGPSGQILRGDILRLGKRLLHAHPGDLPGFRGSTTVYYAMLAERRCTVTVIVLDEALDTGPVVCRRVFDAPHAGVDVDVLYDPDIRARTMVDAVRAVSERGSLVATPQPTRTALPHFVVHPVLKHVALLARSSR
jgi:methionyl-tRNA formyltransferase